jgi:hypothetical protein
MTITKKSFSALEMQQMLGHKEYLPIWYMMRKIRRLMNICNIKHELNGCIEFDEGFLDRVDNKEVIENKNNNSTKTATK